MPIGRLLGGLRGSVRIVGHLPLRVRTSREGCSDRYGWSLSSTTGPGIIKGGLWRLLSRLCDRHIRIPMLGLKHSLNVATAGGVVVYEPPRKYRECFPRQR